MTPQVTVLLPVYNGEKFLAQAIVSVLAQTLEDFELLIINDGSTDKSLDIMRNYANSDARIRIISRENKGLVATLNEGIKLAKGKYIARLDNDDVCMPQRLAEQVKYLINNPQFALCASDACIIDQYGRQLRQWVDLGHSATELKMSLRFSSAFPHSSVCFNADIIRNNQLYYDADYYPAEDFDLFNRIVASYPCCVIRQSLLLWRSHLSSISYQNKTLQLRSTLKVVQRHFTDFGQNVTTEWLDKFLLRDTSISDQDCKQLREILLHVLRAIEEEDQTKQISKRSFAILVNRLAIGIGCIRGFNIIGKVFNSLVLKQMFTRRTKLLFFVSRYLPPKSVFILDRIIFSAYLKVMRIVGLVYWNLKKPTMRPYAEKK